MTTYEEWKESCAAITPEPYSNLGKSGALARLADRLHTYATQRPDPEDKFLGARRFVEHMIWHGVPKEDSERLLALHPWGLSTPTLSPEVRMGILAKTMIGGRKTTDRGLSERLADLYGADLAYCPSLGGWLSWEGQYWKVAKHDHLCQDFILRTGNRLEAEVQIAERAEAAAAKAAAALGPAPNRKKGETEDPESTQIRQAAAAAEARAKEMRKFARDAESGSMIASAVRITRSQGVTVDPEDFNANPQLLPTTNGAVVLGPVATLRENRRSDRMTCVANVGYVPGARSEEWERFIAHVVPDPASRAYLQKLIGYSLYGDNHLRLLIFLLGETSSGKTTLAEIIRAVLGTHASSFKLSLFVGKQTDAPRPDLLAALPKRFIYASETSSRWRLHAEEINNLVGNEHMAARGMASNVIIDQKPACTPFVCCNRPPTILDADQALWERLIVIPCGSKISKSKQDTGLVHRLSTEHGEAVLAWLVEGWNAYQREGLADPPHAVVEATMSLREELSVLDQWLAGKTERADDYKTTSHDLWNAYANWLDYARIAPEDRLSEVGFYRGLKDRGYEPCKVGPSGKRVSARKGLRLKQDIENLI